MYAVGSPGMEVRRMPRRRKEAEASDQWLDRLVEEMYERMERGERPSLSHLLEELLHRLMERKKQRFLEMSKGEQANGFYQRKLYLTLGQLDLKVPRVRRGGCCSACHPSPSLAAGRGGLRGAAHRHARRRLLLRPDGEGRGDAWGCPSPGRPWRMPRPSSESSWRGAKTQPLPPDWFAIGTCAYWAKLRGEGGKMEDISLFVALGAGLSGTKQVLGFWVLKGRESKAA